MSLYTSRTTRVLSPKQTAIPTKNSATTLFFRQLYSLRLEHIQLKLKSKKKISVSRTSLILFWERFNVWRWTSRPPVSVFGTTVNWLWERSTTCSASKAEKSKRPSSVSWKKSCFFATSSERERIQWRSPAIQVDQYLVSWQDECFQLDEFWKRRRQLFNFVAAQINENQFWKGAWTGRRFSSCMQNGDLMPTLISLLNIIDSLSHKFWSGNGYIYLTTTESHPFLLQIKKCCRLTERFCAQL